MRLSIPRFARDPRPLRPRLRLRRQTQPCVTADQAAQMLNKDICISAHIYDVVELPDGTRFLDVCSPAYHRRTCRFTVVSFPEDRFEVGELKNTATWTCRFAASSSPCTAARAWS